MKSELAIKLEHLLKKEQYLLNIEKKELRYIRGGTLITRTHNGAYYFYEKKSGRETGISRDKTRIRMLARKRYLSVSIPHRENICKEINNFLKTVAFCNNKRLNNLNNSHVPELYTAHFNQDTIDWLNESANTEVRYPEQLIFKTNSGILVRSKSEMIIADKLSKYGLPYKYEPELTIQGVTLHPDFMVMRWDGCKIIWEHFGMMSSEQYARQAAKKISLYQEYGFRTHTNLICTYEKDIANPHVLDDIILRFLL